MKIITNKLNLHFILFSLLISLGNTPLWCQNIFTHLEAGAGNANIYEDSRDQLQIVLPEKRYAILAKTFDDLVEKVILCDEERESPVLHFHLNDQNEQALKEAFSFLSLYAHKKYSHLLKKQKINITSKAESWDDVDLGRKVLLDSFHLKNPPPAYIFRGIENRSDFELRLKIPLINNTKKGLLLTSNISKNNFHKWFTGNVQLEEGTDFDYVELDYDTTYLLPNGQAIDDGKNIRVLFYKDKNKKLPIGVRLHYPQKDILKKRSLSP